MKVQLINKSNNPRCYFYVAGGFCWYLNIPETSTTQNFTILGWLWDEFKAKNPELSDSSVIQIVSEVADANEPTKPDFGSEADSGVGGGGSVNPPINPSTKKKYLVYVVAGQSNSVGYDESPITQVQVGVMSDRILQLGYRDNNLQLVQINPCAQNIQNMSSFTNPSTISGFNGTKGIHLPLGAALLSNLPSDYGVIIIPVAYGSTGFTTANVGTYDAENMMPTDNASCKWGADTPYYQTIVDRLKYVLDMADIDAKYAGLIWCQGEQDSSVNDAPTNASGWNAMMTKFANDMSSYNSKSVFGSFGLQSIYVHEFPAWWFTTYETPAGMICGNYQNNVLPRNFVKIPRATDSNAVNGTGATSKTKESHFGNNAFSSVIAPAVRDAIVRTAPSGVYSNVTKPAADSTFTHLTLNAGISKLTSASGSFSAVGDTITMDAALPSEVTIPIILNQATLMFDSAYKLVIFRPFLAGLWFVTKNDTPTIGGSFGLMGMKPAALGASSKIVNGAITAIASNKVNVSFTGADVVMAMIANTKLVFGVYKNKDDSVKNLISIDKSVYADVAGNDAMGVSFGYSTDASVLSSAAPFATSVLSNVVGVVDPTSLFADVDNPTDAEWQNVYTKYAAFIKTY